MRRTGTFVCLFISLFLAPLCGVEGTSYKFVSFKSGMTTDGFAPRRKAQKTRQWRIFKSLYKHATSKKTLRAAPRINKIPKKIHFIWLGGALPQVCKRIVDSWIKFHPTWDVKVWSEADIEAFHLKNKEAYDAALNKGEKSDIARYEILEREGGIYADTDFECLRSFNFLRSRCSFFAGIYLDGTTTFVQNCLIGSIPQHPILKNCIRDIRPGPGDNDGDRIQTATGPGCISRSVLKTAFNGKKSLHNWKEGFKRLKNLGVLPLPMTMVFPLPHTARRSESFFQEIKNSWVKKESIAIHYWSISWLRTPDVTVKSA